MNVLPPALRKNVRESLKKINQDIIKNPNQKIEKYQATVDIILRVLEEYCEEPQQQPVFRPKSTSTAAASSSGSASTSKAASRSVSQPKPAVQPSAGQIDRLPHEVIVDFRNLKLKEPTVENVLQEAKKAASHALSMAKEIQEERTKPQTNVQLLGLKELVKQQKVEKDKALDLLEEASKMGANKSHADLYRKIAEGVVESLQKAKIIMG